MKLYQSKHVLVEVNRTSKKEKIQAIVVLSLVICGLIIWQILKYKKVIV